MTPFVPMLKDRYYLHQQLGQNASRQTWLADDRGIQPHEPIVVKLLALSPQMQWDDSKLFEREAQILQKLNHPRIPQYRDYFILDSLPGSRFPWFCLVQTCIPGSSLQQLLDQGQRFTEADVEKIAIEVLSILIYLHELDPPVLHRDIKPSNLIWGTDDRIYLVDFGAVQDQAVLEGATFTVVGTYGYVPMEQFGGRAVPASDLYALGTTLIHLLTGVAPADLPQQDSRIQFSDRVSLSLGLVNWIGKLTEPHVAERLSTAREALAALENRHALSPPITNRKPRGSQIEMKKSADQLEVRIPPRGSRAIRSVYLVASCLSVSFAFLWWGFMAAVPVVGALSTMLVITFDRTYLRFERDRDRVVFRREIFGIRRRQAQCKVTVITDVIEQEVKKAGEAQGIAIWVGHQGQLITNPLSTLERQWLIQEIREWLDLPNEDDRAADDWLEPTQPEEDWTRFGD